MLHHCLNRYQNSLTCQPALINSLPAQNSLLHLQSHLHNNKFSLASNPSPSKQTHTGASKNHITKRTRLFSTPTMLTPANSLAAAYLTIYLLLLPPTLYTLLRHGRHGILGWGYLLGFSVLRITGAGLQLSSSDSKTAAVINGVGLSPLLLAVLGVLHEASHWIRLLSASSYNAAVGGGAGHTGRGGGKGKPFLLSLVPYLVVHLMVGLGMALVIVGATKTPVAELGKERAGYVVFLIVWVVIDLFVALAWRARGVGGVGGRDARVVS